jgi:hypothetical protein
MVEPVAIVDQHHGTTAEMRRGTTTPINSLATFQLLGFLSRDRLNLIAGDTEIADERMVEYASSAGDRAHRELWLPGNAQFADHQNIERRL